MTVDHAAGELTEVNAPLPPRLATPAFGRDLEEGLSQTDSSPSSYQR
jgi:hypothetical protein